MRVLNFPAVSKKEKRRRPSRPLDYCLGKPEISGAPNPLLSLCVTAASTHSYHPPAPFLHIFHTKILLTYSRLSIQVFSHFPLSFHSAVAPCGPASAPLWPLLCFTPPTPPHPPPVRQWFSTTTHLIPLRCFGVKSWTVQWHSVSGSRETVHGAADGENLPKPSSSSSGFFSIQSELRGTVKNHLFPDHKNLRILSCNKTSKKERNQHKKHSIHGCIMYLTFLWWFISWFYVKFFEAGVFNSIF